MDMVVHFLETFGRLLLQMTGLFLLVMFGMGILRDAIAPKVTKATQQALEKRPGPLGYGVALAGGMVTPFCSCSAVPAAIGMVETSIPLGIVLTFLVASPVIHEGTVVFMWATMGPRFAALFIAAAALVALSAGVGLGQLPLDHQVRRVSYRAGNTDMLSSLSSLDRLKTTAVMVWKYFLRVFPYLVVGMLFGALMEDFVPAATVQRVVQAVGPLGVVIATMIGIPLYARIEVLVPFGVVLLSQGIPVGTVMAFLMATSALSVPEILLLTKLFKPRLLTLYVTAVTLCIMLLGYAFNLAFVHHL
jgi:uncharacterized protein